MNSEILEYQQFAAELKESLENQFQYNLMMGDKVAAHEAVKSMMAYGLIEKTDPRVSVKCTMFGGTNGVNVKDSSNWGMYDYRRTDRLGFIPRYLFCNLKEYDVFNVPTIEHWGKRVEGNYEGDIRIEASSTKIRVSQQNYFVGARRCMEEIQKIFEHNHVKFSQFSEMMDMVNAGVVRIFHIEISGNIESRYRTLGYLICKMNDAGEITVRTVLKFEALYHSWIDIRKFMAAIEQSARKLTVETAIVGHVLKADETIKKQDDMAKQTKIMDINREKLAAKQAAEAEAKATEKAEKAKAKSKKA